MRKLVVLIFLFILLNIQAEQYQIVSIYPHGSKFYVNNKLVDLSKGKPRIDGTARLRFDKNQTVKFRCHKNNKVNIFSITSKENSKYSVDSYLFRYDQAKKKKGTDSVYLEKSIFKNNFKDNKGNIQKRLALIIGNNLYERDTSSCRDLPNTNVDAFDVANKLDTLGFDTYTYFNLSKEDMEFAFRRFVKLAKQENYDVALFYYSGHGIQNDGKNYLVPVDAFYEDVKELAQSCYSFDEIFRSMASTGCKTKLVFLDACRNQPPWADKDDGDQGVSKENANGSYVVFASEPYEYAYAADDNERNSPFTKAFLDNVSKPFPNVRDAVDAMSKSMKNISKPYIFGVGEIDFTFYNEIDTTKAWHEIRLLSLNLKNDIDNHKFDNVKSYISKIDSIIITYNLSVENLPGEYEFAIRKFSRIFEKKGLNLITTFPLNSKQKNIRNVWFNDDSHIASAFPSTSNKSWIYYKWGVYDNSYNEMEIPIRTLSDEYFADFFEHAGWRRNNYVLWHNDSFFIVKNVIYGQQIGIPIPFPKQWNWNSRSFFEKSQIFMFNFSSST